MKGGALVYSLTHVTNTLLLKGKITGVSITPMKLQKLLYFLYKAYLQRTSTPLFSERFQPWQYGPVVSDVYAAFSSYRGNPITSYYCDPDGQSYYVDCEKDMNLKCCLEDVWRRYAHCSGIQLSKFTHLPDSAWTKAVDRNQSVLDDADIKAEPEPWRNDC